MASQRFLHGQSVNFEKMMKMIRILRSAISSPGTPITRARPLRTLQRRIALRPLAAMIDLAVSPPIRSSGPTLSRDRGQVSTRRPYGSAK